MRLAGMVLIIVMTALAVASMASADVRHAWTGTVGKLPSVTSPDPSETLSPDPNVSPTGDATPVSSPSASADPAEQPEADEPPDAEDADEAHAGQGSGHGAAVSAVARDKDAVGSKTLPNGKVVTNHGQAVSAVARSNAGK